MPYIIRIPENAKVENPFNWSRIVDLLRDLKVKNKKFIVSGYMAAAFHGLVRATKYIEIIVATPIEKVPTPFVSIINENRFSDYWKDSIQAKIFGIELHFQSVHYLAMDLANSEDILKKADAIVLQTLIKSLPIADS